MCGIAGFMGRDASSIDASRVLSSFSDKLQHRGPDHTGYCAWNRGETFTVSEISSLASRGKMTSDVGLLHTRLSIIDTSVHGHQPMVSADGRYLIILNGEIYNYRELREKLKQDGIQFTTDSDTEVLLCAYIKWGKKVFSKLVGMFAFCVLDRQENRLFIARDFFGIKPLFYSITGTSFVFASEIKAISVFPGVSKKANLHSVNDYLKYGLVDHTGNTFIENIFSLLPGHYMEVFLDRPHKPVISKYWEPGYSKLSTKDISFTEASQNIREMFLENIMLHMRSDVPIGAALSGGLDSSAIVAGMREIAGDSLDLRTFTYCSRAPENDEEKFADLVIKKTNAHSEKIIIDSGNFVQDMEQLLYFQDEPFGSTSMYAQFKVFQSARNNGIKVLLDGQGADELLAGYTPYYSSALSGFIFSREYKKAMQLILSIKNNGHLSLFNTLLRTFVRMVPEQISQFLISSRNKDQLIKWDWFESAGIGNTDVLSSASRRTLSDTLDVDFLTTNLPGLLRYEDRNSMAHSLESRVPFLTPSFVNFCRSLPDEYMINTSGENKAVFRHAMTGLVPEQILNRKDKIGFQTPESHWLMSINSWVSETLSSEYFMSLPFVNKKSIAEYLLQNQANSSSTTKKLWRYLNLAKWSESNGISFSQ